MRRSDHVPFAVRGTIFPAQEVITALQMGLYWAIRPFVEGKRSLMGLLNFDQLKSDRMELDLSVEDGGISEIDYEEKVMETFRQIGVDAEETL